LKRERVIRQMPRLSLTRRGMMCGKTPDKTASVSSSMCVIN
jgi:hypothetical protein